MFMWFMMLLRQILGELELELLQRILILLLRSAGLPSSSTLCFFFHPHLLHICKKEATWSESNWVRGRGRGRVRQREGDLEERGIWGRRKKFWPTLLDPRHDEPWRSRVEQHEEDSSNRSAVRRLRNEDKRRNAISSYRVRKSRKRKKRTTWEVASYLWGDSTGSEASMHSSLMCCPRMFVASCPFSC